MSKIRVMHVNPSMNKGGIESFLMNVLRTSDSTRYTFIFLTYQNDHFDFEYEILKLGGKIVRISNPHTVSILTHIKEIREAIKREEIDVIHSHTYFDSAYVMIAAKLERIAARIVHSHTALANTEHRILKRMKWSVSKFITSRFATVKIACSKEAGIALFGDKSQFHIVPNGIDLSMFKYNKSARDAVRKKFGIPQNTEIIGHVGRFDTPKNHIFLISVFESYLKINPNSMLLLVGTGKLQNNIRKIVIEKGIEKKVIFLNNRDDVNTLINVFDIFVFPSLYEGLPVSLIEAQANGLSILISDTISQDVILTDCIHSYSLSRSADSWARKISLMSKNRVDTATSADLRNYTVENTVAILNDLYRLNLDQRNS